MQHLRQNLKTNISCHKTWTEKIYYAYNFLVVYHTNQQDLDKCWEMPSKALQKTKQNKKKGRRGNSHFNSS